MLAYGHYLKAMMIFPRAGGKLKSIYPCLWIEKYLATAFLGAAIRNTQDYRHHVDYIYINPENMVG